MINYLNQTIENERNAIRWNYEDSGSTAKNITLINSSNNGIYCGDANGGISNCLIDGFEIRSVLNNDAIALHDGTGGRDNTIKNGVAVGIAENAVDIQAGYSNTLVEYVDAFSCGRASFTTKGLNDRFKRLKAYNCGDVAFMLKGDGTVLSYSWAFNCGRDRNASGVMAIGNNLQIFANHFILGMNSTRCGAILNGSGEFTNNEISMPGLSENYLEFESEEKVMQWNIDNNYYSGSSVAEPFKVGSEKYTFQQWQDRYGHDVNSVLN